MEEKEQLMPLPSVQYHYTERSMAKVSSDFHVRFDNAYYSVDKAYLHKNVSIRATADTVRIYSLQGDFICEWPRASYKGQWQTRKEHLPKNYKDYTSWDRTYFVREAMTVGPNTVKVIDCVLQSRKLEVQTYRLCKGILNYTKKYSKQALEECCRRLLELDRASYWNVKNTIAVVAEELGASGFNTKQNEEKNKGAYIRDPKAMDVENLLSKSRKLADSSKKEADGV